jgi:protocatechuate 3,4-dioxygenase alpha subunit
MGGFKHLLNSMEKLRQTPSQTVGPFFAYGLTAVQYKYDYTSIITGSLMSDNFVANRILISGRVYDGSGNPISDAMIECWQADGAGYYNKMINFPHDGFMGFGRLGTGTDPDQAFQFTTIKPGSTGKNQAPHINIILFMRGSLRHLYTRMYFSDEEKANQSDELLCSVPEERRNTLIGKLFQKDGITEYLFDIHMQGEKETIFFEI